MTNLSRIKILYIMMAITLFAVGIIQSWNVALTIFNLCLISSIMSLGINIQWGNAGIVNFGVMGFAALGGLANIIISMPPTQNAWDTGGFSIIIGLGIFILSIFLSIIIFKKSQFNKKIKYMVSFLIIISGYFFMRLLVDVPIEKIEAIEPAKTGYLGGFNLPVLISWPVGGLLAAFSAYIIGKISLGLRSDYLAIATLGISEIIIYILKNEDWLSRGVKNVNGLPRPVPYEIELQSKEWILQTSKILDIPIPELSSIIVKLSYSIWFCLVLLIVLYLLEIAVKSPWGRMMRAIRDNEVSANAMGKNIKRRHLQVFIIGSAIIGIAGAMLTTLDGQFTPVSYQPLRYTFLIWIMVIVGGSGNNFGSIIGGFLIWFFWVQAEPLGLWFISQITSHISDANVVKTHLLENAAHIRLMFMGLILLLTLRFAPKGLIPEVKR
ncbi:branched-chain amino acid ABC transporter permease [Alphaproteobacteria bacterium]|jgi:branched-chain amino acid transport system permease protein|nr:branched-chain amino acid ABC transporter permease [Alphaproteobacteria bacterium]MDC6452335.1 branched-chain amino acid ABC transporter permease [Alphaproteobacteria bacterium]